MGLAQDQGRVYKTKERKKLAGTGAAMPGGGFPIKTEADLKNAIRAIGRAKNPAAARAHIKRRARSLGLSKLIPDSWKKGDKAMYDCVFCDRAGFATKGGLEQHEQTGHPFSQDQALLFREIEQLLRQALRAKHGRGTYVQDVDDSTVIWASWDNDDERALFKATYTISNEGAVTIGDAVEVRQLTTYVDAASDDIATNTAVNGTPKTDLPHGFFQDEGSHPFFCSECGRSRTHPIHQGS